MGKAVAMIAAALLSLAASVYAQQLDPINNMCNRFDHQCGCLCSMRFDCCSLVLTSKSRREEQCAVYRRWHRDLYRSSQ